MSEHCETQTDDRLTGCHRRSRTSTIFGGHDSLRSLIIGVCCVLALNCESAFAAAPIGSVTRKVLETTLSLAAVGTAAKFSEELGDSVTNYWEDNVPPGESLYSVSFAFNKSSWADWFSDPDVFVVIEREGGPSILLPEIRYNWDGSLMILAFRCPTLPANGRCVIRLMDDDGTSNEVWNSILGSRLSLSLNATPSPNSFIAGMDVIARAEGTVQVRLFRFQV